MAIVTLDKLTVYGPSDQKEGALEGLQRLGCLHLINLRGGPAEQPPLVSKEAREALRYLQGCPIQRRQSRSRAGYEQDRVIAEVLAIKAERGRLSQERDELQQAIDDLQPWGDFQMPAAAEFGVGGFWFYVVPTYRMSELPADLTWQVVNHDEQFTYVVVLAEESPEVLRLTPAELDFRPLSQLQERLETVEERLDELHWRRVTLSRWRDLMRQDLDVADDKAAQQAAAASAIDDGEVFAVQGWSPRSAVADVRRFCDERQLALVAQSPRADDSPPTLLKNPDRVAGAEGCVTFYITPAYQAWDPTTIVFFSFSLFFAMIVSDAGYGLVMAAGLILFWRKLGGTPSAARFRNLLLGIVTATIAYGVVAGSYFGLAPSAGTWLDTLQVKIDGKPLVSNQTAMMAISVAIGVVHLVLANTISAWQHRRSLRSLGHLGWAMIMLGGFLLGVAALADVEPLMQVGETLVPLGAVGVLLFSSEQPVATWHPLPHLRRLFDGVMQFANISKAFGDSLSYLRLFALGLASAQLAVTFNGLAADASHAGGVGLLLALLILLVGHGINFLLGLMGGVVHGLRLNCIEFFNWSLTEEGYAFQPFRRKAVT